jgi:hypothetical protein
VGLIMNAKPNLLLLTALLLTMFTIDSMAQDKHDRLYRIRVNDKYGFIDRQGRVIVPPTLVDAEEFSEGLALVTKKDRVGFIDSHGRMVIEPVFYRAESFADGLALVLAAGGEKNNGVWAYVDRTGKIVFRLFDYVYPSFDPQSFSEGLAAYCKNEKWGYIDKTGKTVIEPQFDRAFAFSEGLAKVRVGEFYGFIDPEGKIVIKPQFPRPYTVDILLRPRPTDYDLSFHDGLAAMGIAPDHQWGYIDQTGNVVFMISRNHHSPFSFSEGLVKMRNDAGAGFFDTKGNVAIEPRWGTVEDFSEGLAAAEWRNSSRTPCEHNNCWGYIDRHGKVVIDRQFSTARPFQGGLAWVSITIPRLNWSDSYKQGYIDQTGKFVWSMIIR